GCRGRLRSLTRLRSAVAYEGPVESAIQRFKYQGWRRLASPLATLIAERVLVEGLAASMVVAVPLHRDREGQRGFNQAELLAHELRRRTGLRAPPGRLLRIRTTVPQVGNDRVHRWQNVKGAFEWRGPQLSRRSEIMVNGSDHVYVEMGGKVVLTNIKFVDEDQLLNLIQFIVRTVGRRIDERSPLCDARLADGSRVNAVIRPLALNGPLLTIRKFA